MIATISLGSCISVQGLLVETLGTGEIVVRVGERLYKGRPIARPMTRPAAA